MLSLRHGGTSVALMGEQHPWVDVLFVPWLLCHWQQHHSDASGPAGPWAGLGLLQGTLGTPLPSCLILSIATEVGKAQQEGADGFLQMVPR